MFAIARFTTTSISPWGESELFEHTRRSLELLAGRPGYLSGRFGVATDQDFDRASGSTPNSVYALVTEWENVGSYRRALSGFEIKMEVVPLLSRALDEPGGFEEIALTADSE
ncbi:MAG: antibiotic biosynthesis monooxygenase [Actinobacteria bacterium]|uniref:Unannotated protein n=1 Tax=freshwater metagenome TaxID=449393 RepID=A0A6J7S5T1_9ZZZZ|nr:antibiotic biosynthesis monooxygenase [Actinomycetota bacterium]MSY27831.1 antibiotic biosynthesis monooxygenase [Actinomycetota bacterium]MSZ86885.1 antibiotic biosynthesis monooxygenase [Actinomycetota bacterium]MTB24714.1 antibiotic biosynthesis monooxygenase [Actinomycetota bacterium]